MAAALAGTVLALAAAALLLGRERAPALQSVPWEEMRGEEGRPREPVRVVGGPHAAVLAAWGDLETLRGAGATVDVKTRTGDGHFVYVDDALHGAAALRDAYESRRLPLRDVLASEDSAVFRYTSENVERVAGLDGGRVAEALGSVLFPERSARETMLWASSRGVRAHAHYDDSDNFFYQLHGSKTMTLVAPDFITGRVHSVLHPLHRQLFHDVAPAARTFTVHLEAGDCLYLPAYWVHAVVAESQPSVSVNTWGQVAHRSIYTLGWPDELATADDDVVRSLIQHVAGGCMDNVHARLSSKEQDVHRDSCRLRLHSPASLEGTPLQRAVDARDAIVAKLPSAVEQLVRSSLAELLLEWKYGRDVDTGADPHAYVRNLAGIVEDRFFIA